MLTAMMIALAVESATAATPGAVFDGLTGACWRTEMSGGTTDTHCFSASEGGKLVMDMHKVRSSDDVVVYEGVTLYRTEGGQVGYSYFNSLGDLMTGTARRSGAVLTFTFQGQPDFTWTLGNNGYDVASGQNNRHFQRVDKGSEGGL